MPFITLRSRIARGAGLALLLAGLSAPALAAPDDVVARVDGTAITEAEVDMAVEMYADQLAQVPEDQRRPMIVDALVDMHIVAAAARKEGLADSDLHKRRMEFLTNQALRTAYLQKNVQDAVTDEELKARYEKDIAGYTPPEEVHAAHILVATEDEAKAVLADIAAGKDFAAIAKEKSTDPGSKENGGDLGFFTKGQMVPEFETEAFALPVGEVSKTPVKTQFGFHVIKVIEKRTQPVPTFEAVREQIVPAVQREKFEALMASLKAGAKIERLDQPPAAPAPAEGGEAAPAPAPAQ